MSYRESTGFLDNVFNFDRNETMDDFFLLTFYVLIFFDAHHQTHGKAGVKQQVNEEWRDDDVCKRLEYALIKVI